MPRAGLSPAVVVAEAAELVDEVGRDGLTLAALAARFGVAVPSLDKHIGGLDDLHRRLAASAVRELGAVLAAAAVDDAALESVAHAYRRYAHAHPGRYAMTVRAPAADDPLHLAASEAVLATMLTVLGRYGIQGDDAVDATRAVRAALHGFVALETAGGFGLPRDVDRSFGRAVAMLDGALRAWR